MSSNVNKITQWAIESAFCKNCFRFLCDKPRYPQPEVEMISHVEIEIFM